MKRVMVYTGSLGRDINLVEVGTTEATPEAVAETANVSWVAAFKALRNPGAYIMVGWAVEGVSDIVADPQEGWEVIEEDILGWPFFKTPHGLAEPFYIRVIPIWEEEG